MSDDEIRKLFETHSSEIRRHFDVMVERMESKFTFLAEHVDEQIDRLDRKVDQLREDMRQGFEETQAMIRFSHAELDRRVRALEKAITDLETRVDRLEQTTTTH
jgi:predicted RNase H-like nuclease (RuvC/YqgF family)